MVISTSDTRANVTPQVKSDLKDIHEKLLKLSSRDEQSQQLAKFKAEAHPETQKFLAVAGLREREHYEFMKVVLSKALPNGSQRTEYHDWSKDEMFFFAAASFYDGGVQTPEMKALVDSELKRHHTLEPHHPEHEKYTGNECSDDDIIEMAVDRLSRNAQFGNGIIQLDQMKKFLPTFTLGDNDRKQKVFWDAVEKYKELVQKEFYDMFPETRKWSKTSAKCVVQ